MSSTKKATPRSGFTLLELSIVALVVGLAATITIPSLLKAREKFRRAGCQQKQAKIIRGVLDYESNHQAFPPGRLYPDWMAAEGRIRQGYTNYSGVHQIPEERTGFYSVHTWILPFVGASAIYEQIYFDIAQAKQMTQGGVPYNVNFEAYNTPMPLFVCPSDPNTDGRPTENNYRVNFGGDTPAAGSRLGNPQIITPRPLDPFHVGGNGAFTMGEAGLTTEDFEDGLSHTVFLSERLKGSGVFTSDTIPTAADIIRAPASGQLFNSVEAAAASCVLEASQTLSFIFSSAGRWPEGSDWSNGWPFAGYDSTQYNHVSPPNWEGIDCGTSAIPDTPAEYAIITARSAHPQSVYVAFGDGHTKRIMNEIDLDVWRAIGTRNGGEFVTLRPTRPKYRPSPRAAY